MKKHNVVNTFFAFECQVCGECCRYLPNGLLLLIEDVKRLAIFFRKDFSYILKKYCNFFNYAPKNKESFQNTVPMLILKTQEGCCPFLSDNKCMVHSHKPYYCSAAPFISIFFDDVEVNNMNISTCKGFGKGREYSEKEIDRQLLLEEKYLSFEYSQYHSWFYDYALKIFKKEINNG